LFPFFSIYAEHKTKAGVPPPPPAKLIFHYLEHHQLEVLGIMAVAGLVFYFTRKK